MRKERNDVRAEIEGIASQIFDLKQAERRERIQQLRAALTELEVDVTLRDAERNKRIDDFIEDPAGPVDLDLMAPRWPRRCASMSAVTE